MEQAILVGADNRTDALRRVKQYLKTTNISDYNITGIDSKPRIAEIKDLEELNRRVLAYAESLGDQPLREIPYGMLLQYASLRTRTYAEILAFYDMDAENYFISDSFTPEKKYLIHLTMSNCIHEK